MFWWCQRRTSGHSGKVAARVLLSRLLHDTRTSIQGSFGAQSHELRVARFGRQFKEKTHQK